MLLLLNNSIQGIFVWQGPVPSRTVLIEAEPRIVLVT